MAHRNGPPTYVTWRAGTTTLYSIVNFIRPVSDDEFLISYFGEVRKSFANTGTRAILVTTREQISHSFFLLLII
jgi:hypothetical protein